MLIQKTFHLAMKAEVAREKLLKLTDYRGALEDLDRVTFEPNGLLRVGFRLPLGFRTRIYLAREWGDDPQQILFRSHGGNVEIFGSVDFYAIRPNLTEVVLTMEYAVASPFYRWLDRWKHGMEAYIDRQIAAVEGYFSRPSAGIRADRNLPSPMNGHSHDEAA